MLGDSLSVHFSHHWQCWTGAFIHTHGAIVVVTEPNPVHPMRPSLQDESQAVEIHMEQQ